MPIPYFGRIHFSWCKKCNVPLIIQKKCSLCGEEGITLQITPPGEIRPLFEKGATLYKEIITQQYGEEASPLLIPANQIVLLNKISGPDRAEELIVGGHTLGKFLFDPINAQWRFQITLAGAEVILSSSENIRKVVVIDQDAVKYIAKGANVLGPGVLSAENSINIGDDVIVVSPTKKPICVGKAGKPSQEMMQRTRGVAVKPREYQEETVTTIVLSEQTTTWDDVIQANKDILKQRVGEAIGFIRRVSRKFQYPISVAFSGGKDSLATFLLVEKALEHKSFSLFFADTGIEFPETVEFVHQIAREHNLEDQLIIEEAGERFWSDLEVFGPPSRDYRWCCKTCKLAPINKGIEKHYPGGVITFVGQRRFESRQRSQERMVNKNPWIPGQIRALPIFNWSSLLVWLFLFQEKAPIPSLYYDGYDRIGCWLCPANKMADFQLLHLRHPELEAKWNSALQEYAKKNKLAQEWIQFGLWRWKSPSKALRQHLENAGIAFEFPKQDRPKQTLSNTVTITSGVSPCRMGGFSLEGKFSNLYNMDAAKSFLQMLGDVAYSDELGALRLRFSLNSSSANLFADGSFVIRAKNEEELAKIAKQFILTIVRSQDCTGCGICVQQCQERAIKMENGRPIISGDKCKQCLQCLSYCPLVLNQDYLKTL